MVNELKTALPQPPGVTFKVLKYSDRSPLLINNQEEMEVLSSVSREEFTVLDIQSAKGNNPANIYLFKVNNRKTRKRCEICSKLILKLILKTSFCYLYC